MPYRYEIRTNRIFGEAKGYRLAHKSSSLPDRKRKREINDFDKV